MQDICNLGYSTHQYGYASVLRRHNAVEAKHKSWGMTDFLQVLSEHHEDLTIEEYDPIEPFKPVKGPNLLCSKCNKLVSHTLELFDHVMEDHITTPDRHLYTTSTGVHAPVMEIINKSMTTQAEQTYMRKQFMNHNKYIASCRVDSPLAAFLTLFQVRMYLNETPASRAAWAHKYVRIVRNVENQEHVIYFSFAYRERYIKGMLNARRAKEQEKIEKILAERCATMRLRDQDLFTKKRTEEETKYLAMALGLPADHTPEQLQIEIDNNTVSQPLDIQRSYAETAAADGRLLSNEERKLISTLTNRTVTATGRKRQCTKNKKYI